jgi:hypothetical protein
MENNHGKKLETKEELVRTIREWVKNDNEIRALQKEQNKRREIKKQISEDLINVMKNNNIDCFDINDGKLMYTRKNIKKPITRNNLIAILSQYYEGDIEKAVSLNDFIMENREETVKETITRKLTKNI